MPTRDPRDLARDWVTLWQSEVAAVAVDREAQESVQALAALWANAASAFLAAMPDGFFPPGPGGAHAAPRAAPAAAAPDPRDAQLARLAGRIAELERRIADLERRRGGG
jgi:hypothetical protein